MTNADNTPVAVLSAEPETAKVDGSFKPPVPKATGNDKVEILKHSLANMDVPADGAIRAKPGVELAIRNVSNTTIATMVFQVVLYDHAGNVLDTLRQREVALEPDRSRGIVFFLPPYFEDKVKSYDVKITRMTTADFEKVQLRRHEEQTTDSGEEVITGIVKNISPAKTDAAVVATFLNNKSDIIGTRVAVLRDIDANSIRQYAIKFKPQDGESVSSFTLQVGDLV